MTKGYSTTDSLVVEGVLENAFGAMANTFGCLVTAMPHDPKNVTCTVVACCIMLNLATPDIQLYTGALLHKEEDLHILVPRQWRQGLNLEDIDVVSANSQNHQEAENMFDTLLQLPSGSSTMTTTDAMTRQNQSGHF